MQDRILVRIQTLLLVNSMMILDEHYYKLLWIWGAICNLYHRLRVSLLLKQCV